MDLPPFLGYPQDQSASGPAPCRRDHHSRRRHPREGAYLHCGFLRYSGASTPHPTQGFCPGVIFRVGLQCDLFHLEAEQTVEELQDEIHKVQCAS